MEFEVAGKVHRPQIGEELLIPAGAMHSARNIGTITARWLYGTSVREKEAVVLELGHGTQLRSLSLGQRQSSFCLTLHAPSVVMSLSEGSERTNQTTEDTSQLGFTSGVIARTAT